MTLFIKRFRPGGRREMITNWTSKQACGAIEKMGPIMSMLPSDISLAILQRHAREWLEARDIFIDISRDDGDVDRMLYQAVRSGRNYTNRPITQWVDDYDECLLAAIEAAEGGQ